MVQLTSGLVVTATLAVCPGFAPVTLEKLTDVDAFGVLVAVGPAIVAATVGVSAGAACVGAKVATVVGAVVATGRVVAFGSAVAGAAGAGVAVTPASVAACPDDGVPDAPAARY
jgi:hypothetical protein